MLGHSNRSRDVKKLKTNRLMHSAQMVGRNQALKRLKRRKFCFKTIHLLFSYVEILCGIKDTRIKLLEILNISSK